MNEKLLTLEEAQVYLKVSRSTILRLVKKGEIQAYKVGNSLRFYEKDLKMAVKPTYPLVNVEKLRNRVKLIDIESS